MIHPDLIKLRQNLPLPSLLQDFMAIGRWIHPGDDVLRIKIPAIKEPVVFLESKGSMVVNSGPLMASQQIEDQILSEYRGSVIPQRELPWIDVERTLFLAINKIPGDDVGIALDYRTGVNAPRVIVSDWGSGKDCRYVEISSSFEKFVELLSL